MYQRFGHAEYPYTLFEMLMKKLRDTATENRGFWFNRHIILREARDLTIVVNDKNELVAFYIFKDNESDNETEICFFQVFIEGKGIGRRIIERESLLRGGRLCVLDAVQETRGFWKKMGIKIKSK
jgi:hypothetical protein